MKNVVVHLCIALLAFANCPAQAQAAGANSSPTCDEISPAQFCGGYAVPEVLVTAPYYTWLDARWLDSVFRGLGDQALAAFIAASIRHIREQLPEDVTELMVYSAQLMAQREEQEREQREIAKVRVAELNGRIKEFGLTYCSEIAYAAQAAGLIVATSAAVMVTGGIGGVLSIPAMVRITGGVGLSLTGLTLATFVCEED